MIYRELRKIIKYKSIIFFVFFFLLIVSVMNTWVMFEPDVTTSKNSLDGVEPISIEEIKDDEGLLKYPLSVIKEIDTLRNRDDYIKKSIEDIDKKLNLPMIDMNEKKLLNIEKDSLVNILGMDLKFTHTEYFYNYINNIKYSGFLFVCLLIFIFYYMFYQDIENSLISLYKTYSLSLKKLYIYKFIAFLILSFIIVFIWGLIDYSFLTISGTKINIFIQNINGFYLAPLKFTLLEYMILNIGLIYLTTIFLILLFSFLLFLLKKVGFALMGLFAFILLEFNLYNNITLGSSKEIFKLFNIFSFFERPFSRIIPINFIFNGQFEFIAIVINIVLLIVFLVLSCILYGSGVTVKNKFGGLFKGINTNNIVINEAYNILLGAKGITILLLLILFSYMGYKDFNYVRPYNYESLSITKREYYGNIDDKLISKIEEDTKEAEKYYNRVLELLQLENRSDEEEKELMEISPISSNYQNLVAIHNEIELARSNGASFYIDTEPTDFLHSVKKNYNFYRDTFIGIGLIGLLTSFYISSNYNSRIEKLYGTMRRINSRNAIRLGVLYLVSIIIFSIIIGTHIAKLYKGFYYKIADISINNIFPISSTMNYKAFLGLTLFSYFLLIFTIVNISYYISSKNSIINSFIIIIFINILMMLGYFILPQASPISIIRYEIFDNIYIFIFYILAYIGTNILILKSIFK